MDDSMSFLKRYGYFFIAGLILIGAAVWGLFIKPTNLDKFTATADDGKIVSVKKHYHDDDDTYTPTIEFTDSDHISHQAASIVEYSRKPSVGTKVSVRYDPRNPDDGCLIAGDEAKAEKSKRGKYFMLAGGLFCVGMGVWMGQPF